MRDKEDEEQKRRETTYSRYSASKQRDKSEA